ncbi:hypothetical protein ACH42_05500 [Endozoicomonas sp. (ex Bugula neritina AB1)]|nr:hypothetical protein ACH42_05500 [Endozoicomonas sp. (ex Bugula neritina AB1)]
MTTKQKLHIDRKPQLDIFACATPQKVEDKPEKTPSSSPRRFIAPDAETIYLGNTSLKNHLKMAGQKTPITISQLLDEQNWTTFEALYSESGRPPYAPRSMVGLVLYGIMQGITSLRALERLARLDLGCMWVSGGIFPDHANIGRFINRHAELLTGSFFEELVLTVLNKTNSKSDRLAGDGTVIEAACSNYNLIKEEAVHAVLEEARKQLEKSPEDPDKKANLEKKTDVQNQLKERQERRKRAGSKAEEIRISPVEPDAVVQKMKRRRGHAPSYKPSVLVNEQRVVVAQAVDPSNEAQVIPEMLNQVVRIAGTEADELLLDGGYCCESVITTTLDRDISLLCPEGRKPGELKKSKKFQKGHFRYDEITDSYQCPAGQRLTLLYKPEDPCQQRAQWVYGGAPCDGCPLKEQCTTSKKGRTIRRFKIDDARSALKHVMEHPAAKAVFRKRQAMVEPVFGYLRTVQNLNRFRRRGLNAVKLEFSLHLLAYNLSRVVAAYFAVFIWVLRSHIVVQELYLRRMAQRELNRNI